MPAPEPIQTCSNCKYFLLVDALTNKGICRIDPPHESDDRNAAPILNNADGRRWPVCWKAEWCGKWTKVVGG